MLWSCFILETSRIDGAINHTLDQATSKKRPKTLKQTHVKKKI